MSSHHINNASGILQNRLSTLVRHQHNPRLNQGHFSVSTKHSRCQVGHSQHVRRLTAPSRCPYWSPGRKASPAQQIGQELRQWREALALTDRWGRRRLLSHIWPLGWQFYHWYQFCSGQYFLNLASLSEGAGGCQDKRSSQCGVGGVWSQDDCHPIQPRSGPSARDHSNPRQMGRIPWKSTDQGRNKNVQSWKPQSSQRKRVVSEGSGWMDF